METIVIVAASVIGALSLIYGFVRKASRVSWGGLEILLCFAPTLLLGVIEPLEDETVWFFLVVGALLLWFCVVMGVSALIRRAVFRMKKPKRGVSVCSRFLGALLALINAAVFAAALAGLALAVINTLSTPPAALKSFLSSAIWKKTLSAHAYDLFVVALFFVFARAGLRLGLLRGIFYLIMFALTFASFVGAIALATKVALFEGWGASLAGAFSSLSPAAASVLGHGIVALALFAVLFAVAMALGALLHWGLRKFLGLPAVGAVSSFVLLLLFAFVFLAGACLVNYGIAYLGSGALGEGEGMLAEAYDLIGKFTGSAAALFTSSPFSAVLYLCNPFLALLGL